MLGERCVWWWGFRVEWLGLEAAACGLTHSRRGGIVRWWGSGGPEPHFELPTPPLLVAFVACAKCQPVRGTINIERVVSVPGTVLTDWLVSWRP